MSAFFDFYGYDLEINVGNLVINTMLKDKQYGLCDKWTMTGTENTSRTCTFTFIPPEQTIDLESFQGEKVQVFVRDSIGWSQVFDGVVDVPTLDFINRKISLQCSDQRSNKVMNLPYSYIQQIGEYDQSVFGAPLNQTDEFDKRLQTVAASFDFDNYGNPILTPWIPNPSPNFVFTSADILQLANPTITYTNRSKTVNNVELTIKYSYQRLHQQCATFVWTGYGDFINDWYNQGSPSFPARTQVNSAATGSNWKLINPNAIAQVVPLWPAGGYSGIVWQPNQVTPSYVGRTVFTGYLQTNTTPPVNVVVGTPPALVPQYAPVKDANGKQIMDVVSETIVDTSSALCRGAEFTSALRFSQTVVETYNVSIFAPQSIAKYRAVTSNSTISITDAYDTAQWDNSVTVTQVAENFFIDQKAVQAKLISAISCAYAKARHDILQVHRDRTINFRTKILQPRVDLKHTIDFTVEDPLSSTAHIHAIAKASIVTHTIDFKLETAYTDITMALSRSDGFETDSVPAVNLPVQDSSYIGQPPSIVLGTHLGVDPNPCNTWRG
jgi:hypothetical protein